MLILGSAALGVAFLEDNHIRVGRRNSWTEESNEFFLNFKPLGDWRLPTAAFFSLYLGEKLFGNSRVENFAKTGVESLIFTGMVTTILKFSFGRERPYVSNDPHEYRAFRPSGKFNSFPSGHTSTAFTVASVVSEEFDNRLVDVAAYGLASMVAIQRVWENSHWASDAVGGAIIGTWIGKTITHARRKRRNLELYPFYQPTSQTAGIAFSFRY